MHLPGGAATFRSPCPATRGGTVSAAAVNQIRAVTFRPVPAGAEPDREGGHARFIALDLAEPPGLAGFLEDVVTRFKHERMSGPTRVPWSVSA